MTTILDLTLLPARDGGPHTNLHFAIDGAFDAAEALNEIAPGACYDQLGLPALWPDRTIRELVRAHMPAGWVCIPSATTTDGGGSPRITFAKNFRGAGRAPRCAAA